MKGKQGMGPDPKPVRGTLAQKPTGTAVPERRGMKAGMVGKETMKQMGWVIGWAVGAAVGFAAGLTAARRAGPGASSRTAPAGGDEVALRKAAIDQCLANARLYANLGLPVEEHAWKKKAHALAAGVPLLEVEPMLNFELEKEWRDGTMDKIKAGQLDP